MTSDPDLDSHGKYMQRVIAGKNTRQGRNGTNFDKDDAARVYWLASPYSGATNNFCAVTSSGAAHANGGGSLPRDAGSASSYGGLIALRPFHARRRYAA
jgi:hypothetical protein